VAAGPGTEPGNTGIPSGNGVADSGKIGTSPYSDSLPKKASKPPTSTLATKPSLNEGGVAGSCIAFTDVNISKTPTAPGGNDDATSSKILLDPEDMDGLLPTTEVEADEQVTPTGKKPDLAVDANVRPLSTDEARLVGTDDLANVKHKAFMAAVAAVGNGSDTISSASSNRTIPSSSPKKNPPSYADIASAGNNKDIAVTGKEDAPPTEANGVADAAFTTPSTTTVAVTVESKLEDSMATHTSPSPKNLYSIFSKTPSKSPALTTLGKT